MLTNIAAANANKNKKSNCIYILVICIIERKILSEYIPLGSKGICFNIKLKMENEYSQ